MKNQFFRVEGMTCDHCVQTIKDAVNKLIGITKIEIDLQNKIVAVNFDQEHTNVESIKEKMISAGFKVSC